MKLIDKDAVVAEIKRRLKFVEKRLKRNNSYTEEGNIAWKRDKALYDSYNQILSFINSLEVTEVNLEKEFNSFLDNIEGTPRMYHSDEQMEWGKDIAKHFFELGAKQISEDIKIGETQIYLDDDGGEPPYDGKQWLDLSCTEYEIPSDKFKDGDKVEFIIRKVEKGE